MRKERFPSQRKSKLQPQGNSPFQILEHINDNTYKVDLAGKYHVSITFNVFFYLSPFHPSSDSRTNPFEERGNDVIQGAQSIKDPLLVLEGSIKRARAKKINKAMQGFV